MQAAEPAWGSAAHCPHRGSDGRSGSSPRPYGACPLGDCFFGNAGRWGAGSGDDLGAGGVTVRSEQLARSSLVTDAIYCAAVGAVAAAAADRFSQRLGLPSRLVRGAGFATVGWAATVAGMARRKRWREALATVFIANVVVCALLAGWGWLDGNPRRRRLLWSLAAQVGGFAAAQATALRRS